MHIIWHGQSCFQIIIGSSKGEQVSLLIDPFDASIGLKTPSVSADLLLISHQHQDHNNKKAVKNTPFLIEGPGEYEIKEVFVQGISSFHDDQEGKERGQNTIYSIETEELRICHLGDLGQKELNDEQLEKIGDVDILMVPVGGVYTLDAKGAAKIISQVEPKVVIPMHYHIPGLKVKIDGVDKFLKEMGRKSDGTEEKLVIKKKDLPEEMKIVVLKP